MGTYSLIDQGKAKPASSSNPDLAQGVAFDDLEDGGLLAGHVGDEAVVLARRGSEVFAIGATCTHWETTIVRSHNEQSGSDRS